MTLVRYYLERWWKCLYGRSGATKVKAITLNKCRFPHNKKFKMPILTWLLGDNAISSQRPSLLQSIHLKSTCRDRGHWVTYTGLKSTEECKLFGVILLNFSYLFICILACPAKILPFLGCLKYVSCKETVALIKYHHSKYWIWPSSTKIEEKNWTLNNL